MRVLVIGGTRFVGRALTEALLESGDTPTLFHRGQTGADLFPEVAHVLGDRNDGFEALGDGTWDAVVDVCAYVPRHARQLGDALAERVGRGIIISTISVYDDPTATDYHEHSQRAILPDPTAEAVDGTTYGGLKALTEDAFLDAWGERSLIVRPGLIVGPHDPTDRFTYWPVRLAQGPTIAPDRPEQPVQWVDVRDLAAFLVRALHAGRSGIVNACGPTPSLPLGEFLPRISMAVAGVDNVQWIRHERLVANDVAPWSDLPMTLPFDGSGDAMLRTDGRRMEDVDDAFRPLEETARDSLAWFR